jgi:3-oxoacyl-[acyl-carrier-protein] synthase II
MIAAVTGVGWVSTESMGSGRNHQVLESKDGKLPKLMSRMVFGEVLPRFGRLDEYSKLGLAGIAFALKDARQDQRDQKRPAGIIVSSTYGCLVTDMEYFEGVIANGGSLASPNLFALTLPNIFLGEAAIRFGLTGPGFAVNGTDPGGTECLSLALDGMSLDENPMMIVGTSDPGCPPLFPCHVTVTPGSLFFVLEKHPIDGSLSYGELDMTSGGEVLFNRVRIQNLTSRFQGCLPSLEFARHNG